jgi:hypothetical protein
MATTIAFGDRQRERLVAGIANQHLPTPPALLPNVTTSGLNELPI